MSGCSQTNIPTIQITPDPCNGEQFSSKCVFHQPQIFYLNLPENTSLQSIITALASKTQQQENSLVYLSQNLQQQINQLEEDTAPKYKVYTALLTQSGGDVPFSVNGDGEQIVLGTTYEITENPDNNDLTIYGAPNNNVGTFFVANQTTNLPYTNSLQLIGNTGAPVVKVLENTIGNIWFSYIEPGIYYVNSNDLFTINKYFAPQALNGYDTNVNNGGGGDPYNWYRITDNQIAIILLGDNKLNNTPIEIRVYN
jgi:hypothetical protein